jgi:ATP-binding cassette subfamily B protein
MTVEVIADIMSPTYMKEIIDVGVANGDVVFILGRGRLMLLIAVAGLIGGAGNCVFSTIASARFGANLRNGLFKRIQSLSYSEIDKLTTSSLITRLTNDVSQMQQLVMMVLRGMFRMPLLCAGGVIASFILSPKMSLIYAISIPILFIVVFFVIKRALPLAAAVQKKLDRINTVTRENLLGALVVKAFVGQAREKKRFETANGDLMQWSLKQSYLIIILTPISTFVLNASVIALFWFGGNTAISGNLETGTIMALLTYMTQALSSFVQVIMLMINISRATASVQRINEVLDTESSIRDPETAEPPQDASVTFDNVSFRYNDDGDYVLKSINLTIKSGETLGIIGATGSGKSTLAALIPRLYDVSRGEVRIGGVNVKNIARSQIASHVGMVLQESVLFAGTIEENLCWAVDGDIPLEQIEQAASDAQALDFIRAKPEGFASYVEQRGGNFSGGQKQRISIARTFLGRPKILILDDSTSALDTETDAKIRAAIARRSAAETTVVIIAQRIAAIMNADRILVLDNGEVSDIGTHSELIRSNEIYRAIAESQLGVTE